jgi:hypothetical protein
MYFTYNIFYQCTKRDIFKKKFLFNTSIAGVAFWHLNPNAFETVQSLSKHIYKSSLLILFQSKNPKFSKRDDNFL